jgi:hypothetical protein
MRIRLFAILILAFMGGGAAMAAVPEVPAAWQKVMLAGTALTVDLPGAAVKDEDIVQGGLRSVAYRVNDGPNKSYITRADQVPAGGSIEGRFERARDGASGLGTLRAERALAARDGAEGREFVIDSIGGTEPYTTVTRIYLHGDWTYALVATVPRGTERGAVVARFLDSARFANR